MGQIYDILEYGMRAILLLYLCENAIEWKEKIRKHGKYLFCLLFVIIGFWLSNSKRLEQLLYGKEMIMKNSSQSIVKLLLVIILFFLLLDFFFQGSRLMKWYMALLYEVMFELTRFAIHGFWSLGFEKYLVCLERKVENGSVSLDTFYHHMKMAEYIGLFILIVLNISILYVIIRWIRKYQRICMQDIQRKGILFLMIFPAIGFAFDLVLRCLWITSNEGQIDFLYDKHSSMYVIVPIMTILCLLAIVYSIKIYGELMQAEEEKHGFLFYKQQLSDMTEHVQEMERLYDGIRGMRHDMNNYIADMEQLLGISKLRGNLEENVENEAQNYLYRMQNTLDNLTLHYHTGNPVMDVIMNRKSQECEKAKIIFEGDFFYPEKLGIEAFDLGILLNNALDNAIEACGRCVEGKDKCISIHSYQKGKMFFLQIENSCNGDEIVYTKEQTFRTSKEDEWQHGIGLKNMKSIVERYYGTMIHEVRDEKFLLTIMLQGK